MADTTVALMTVPKRESPRIFGPPLVSGAARLHRSGRGFTRNVKDHLPGWYVINAGARPSRARDFVPSAASCRSVDLAVHCTTLSNKQAFWSRSWPSDSFPDAVLYWARAPLDLTLSSSASYSSSKLMHKSVKRYRLCALVSTSSAIHAAILLGPTFVDSAILAQLNGSGRLLPARRSQPIRVISQPPRAPPSTQHKNGT